jgi:hypothetical protein
MYNTFSCISFTIPNYKPNFIFSSQTILKCIIENEFQALFPIIAKLSNLASYRAFGEFTIDLLPLQTNIWTNKDKSGVAQNKV